MHSTPSLAIRAMIFAKDAHALINHRRKYTGEPYILHPIAVAGIVNTVMHSEEMLAAAFLHDTVEDTRVEISDIREHFGNEVAELVGWLTDVSTPNDGNREARKKLDREHIAKAPAAAKTIKLADLIDNTHSIVSHDPKFAGVYLREKRALLEVLREGDSELWAQADHLVKSSLLRIEGEIE